MNRVIHFDIYADDTDRATEFYKNAFNWKFEKWNGSSGMNYWLITTGSDKEPGINGGMSKREKEWAKNVSSDAITIGVDDIDKAIADVKKFGGKITLEKTAIPTVGWFANFSDTEGNILSLMQSDMEGM
jgi:predicted enzyme related to lactoylglutathione lyase